MLYCRRSIGLFILIVSLTFFVSCQAEKSQPGSVASDTMETLVSTEWLSQHLGDSDLVVLDCTVLMEPDSGGGMRAVSGRTQYEEGHIPSAGFADLTGDLADVDSPFQFALPTPEQFCAAMGKLGVGDNSRVVLYDTYNSVWAARVWWMLRWVGFDRAALLDGGLNAWKAEERQLSAEPSAYPIRQLTPALRPALIADRDEVFAAISDDAVVLIDAMPEAHFRGEMAMYARPGHIPTARNISVMALTDESGHYRSHDELAAMFDGDRKARSITYCGGGIAASSSAFVMVRLGFEDVAVYMGSLQEWAADPANPMVVDEH
jgi:thiosulfate/3-mercaptopyruvate sulfurtransferase